MKFIILILSMIIGIKTVSYGIYEMKKNNNKLGGSFVIVLAFISAITPNIIVYLKGV